MAEVLVDSYSESNFDDLETLAIYTLPSQGE